MTNLTPELQEVIKTSWFTVEKGIYVYTKVESVREPEKHLIITRDDEEITVVTEEANLENLGPYERNPEDWVLLNIKCGNPFYCVGFLSSIASVFSQNGIDITVTSTYTRDYIMVQKENLDKSIDLLIGVGFRREGE